VLDVDDMKRMITGELGVKQVGSAETEAPTWPRFLMHTWLAKHADLRLLAGDKVHDLGQDIGSPMRQGVDLETARKAHDKDNAKIKKDLSTLDKKVNSRINYQRRLSGGISSASAAELQTLQLSGGYTGGLAGGGKAGGGTASGGGLPSPNRRTSNSSAPSAGGAPLPSPGRRASNSNGRK
jgi:hypothetical protein